MQTTIWVIVSLVTVVVVGFVASHYGWLSPAIKGGPCKYVDQNMSSEGTWYRGQCAG